MGTYYLMNLRNLGVCVCVRSVPDLLFQQGSAQGHSLFQLLSLTLLLRLCLHFNLTLIRIQQLQLLLQLHPQHLTLSLLCLIQSQLRERGSVYI